MFIVYENGRAYPRYRVRYYRGERDPERTPFASREEACVNNGAASAVTAFGAAAAAAAATDTNTTGAVAIDVAQPRATSLRVVIDAAVAPDIAGNAAGNVKAKPPSPSPPPVKARVSRASQPTSILAPYDDDQDQAALLAI